MASSPLKWIALGLYAPDERYVLARHFRKYHNFYIDGEYSGQMEIWGYFTLIRPYADKIDVMLSEWRTPKLLGPALTTGQQGH